MKILVFGNVLVEEDNLSIRILPKLRQLFPDVEFLHVDPTESLETHGENLIAIDVVHGINKPTIITDPRTLILPNVNSMHDFDLAYNLKLLISVEKIKSIKIYGLPHDMSEEKALEWLKEKLE